MRFNVAFVMLVASSMVWAQEQQLSKSPKLLEARDLSIAVEPDALQRQFLALQGMPLVAVEYSRFGSVKTLVGDTDLVLPSRAHELKSGDTADDVLQLFSDLLLANGTETLTVTAHDLPDSNPYASAGTLRFSQEIRGIPVINGFIGLNYDKESREVSKLVAVFVPDRGLDPEAKVSSASAEKLVPEAIASTKEGAESRVEILEGTQLAYYHAPTDPTPPRLVWLVQAQVDYSQWVFYVNAITGVVIDRAPLTQALTRKVYNANGATWTIPNQVPSNSMTTALTCGSIL